MEKNPLQQQQGKYPWAKINKTKIIPQCPNHKWSLTIKREIEIYTTPRRRS